MVPAALIGRLAIAMSFRGRKLGSALLADAIARAADTDLATFAVLVDPKDEGAKRFYEGHGFAELAPPETRMFMTAETARRLMRTGA